MNQKGKEIDQSKSTTNKLVREQETTYEDISLFKTIVNDIKRDVNQFEENGIFVATRSLIIDTNRIYIEQWPEKEVDVSRLGPPLHTIDCVDNDNGSPAMTCNNHFLLVNQHPNLCLFDRNLTAVRETLWEYGFISDMCWSSTLNCFIIITSDNGVFHVDEYATSIKSIEMIENKKWSSCTCSDATLFLTTDQPGSNIFQFNLLSSFQQINQQNNKRICQNNESIDNIAYNNGKLALMIHVQNQSYHRTTTCRIELRSSITLDRLWNLSLKSVNTGNQIYRLCLLRCDEWLVIDSENSSLIQISNDGQLKIDQKYTSKPQNAIFLPSNILAIRTNTSINFYEMQ